VKTHSVEVHGKPWEIHFTSKLPKGEHGYCTRPDKENRRIAINSRLKTEAMVATIVHELVHAVSWRTSEEIVEEIGEVVADVLLRPEILSRLKLYREEKDAQHDGR